MKPLLIGIAAIIVAALIAYPGRLYYLRNKSKSLINASSSFAREYSVGVGSGSLRTYAILGDSTAVGTGATKLEATYPYLVAQSLAATGNPVIAMNFAENGATCEDVLAKQLPKLAGLKPDVITVSVGANDVTRHTAPEAYKEHVTALVAALEATGATILLANTPDMAMVPAFPPPYPYLVGKRSISQNEIFNAIPKSPAITVVDLYGSGRLDAGGHSDYYAADSFHPSDAGYAVWANVFIKALPSS